MFVIIDKKNPVAGVLSTNETNPFYDWMSSDYTKQVRIDIRRAGTHSEQTSGQQMGQDTVERYLNLAEVASSQFGWHRGPKKVLCQSCSIVQADQQPETRFGQLLRTWMWN